MANSRTYTFHPCSFGWRTRCSSGNEVLSSQNPAKTLYYWDPTNHDSSIDFSWMDNMENQLVEEFLDHYKKLEQLLKVKYANDSGRYDSVITRYENSKECGVFRDELNAIRQIRNLLQHNPKIGGSYIAEPSEKILSALQAIIRQIEHPKLAIDYGVKIGQIYKTTLGSSLMDAIRTMKEKGYSHIPVIQNNILYGVLSAYTVFEFVTEQGMQILTRETRVSAMKPYLPIDKHKNETYRFLPKTATFTEADEAFEKRDAKRRRLVAIFITQSGSPREPVLAMLTPWSVVGK